MTGRTPIGRELVHRLDLDLLLVFDALTAERHAHRDYHAGDESQVGRHERGNHVRELARFPDPSHRYPAPET